MAVLLKLPLIALLVTFGAACVSPSAPTSVRFATPFELPVGKSVVLPDGLRIKFDRVSADSRCPLDAVCITAGDAAVVLLVSQTSGTPVPVELHTVPNASQTVFANHRIALTALLPHPRANQQTPANQYVATLTVDAQ